jgi:hypothetical protein
MERVTLGAENADGVKEELRKDRGSYSYCSGQLLLIFGGGGSTCETDCSGTADSEQTVSGLLAPAAVDERQWTVLSLHDTAHQAVACTVLPPRLAVQCCQQWRGM